MNIYEMMTILDNPLYEGLATPMDFDDAILDTYPSNWIARYQTWKPRLLAKKWVPIKVIGNVRAFNDYPGLNEFPAFSSRAVDLLRDFLEPNGELLPVQHKIGTYYYFNCTRMANIVDLSKSRVTYLDGGLITDVDESVFIEEAANDLIIFKERTQLVPIFCTQPFVDRVNSCGLDGFAFIKVCPLKKGSSYHREREKVQRADEKRIPKGRLKVKLTENTVVIRLYCKAKKASKTELAAVERIMETLEKVLYDSKSGIENYVGNVEGHDVLDNEIRVFLSAPDCDLLIERIKPTLRKLSWKGAVQVVKRRGELFDESAGEEYVKLD